MHDTAFPTADALPGPHTFAAAGSCGACGARGPMVGCIDRESPLLATLRVTRDAIAAREAAQRAARGPARALPGQLRLFADDGAPALPAAPRAPAAAPGERAHDPAPQPAQGGCDVGASAPRKREYPPPIVHLCAECTLAVVGALAVQGRGPGGIGYEWATAARGVRR